MEVDQNHSTNLDVQWENAINVQNGLRLFPNWKLNATIIFDIVSLEYTINAQCIDRIVWQLMRTIHHIALLVFLNEITMKIIMTQPNLRSDGNT
jgi:hypothetical protein